MGPQRSPVLGSVTGTQSRAPNAPRFLGQVASVLLPACFPPLPGKAWEAKAEAPDGGPGPVAPTRAAAALGGRRGGAVSRTQHPRRRLQGTRRGGRKGTGAGTRPGEWHIHQSVSSRAQVLGQTPCPAPSSPGWPSLPWLRVSAPPPLGGLGVGVGAAGLGLAGMCGAGGWERVGDGVGDARCGTLGATGHRAVRL